jgi:hypothetical protein
MKMWWQEHNEAHRAAEPRPYRDVSLPAFVVGDDGLINHAPTGNSPLPGDVVGLICQ